MRVEIVKEYSPAEMEEMKNGLLKKYGSRSVLQQKIAHTGCTRPEYVDDYMLLYALESKNPSFRHTRIYTSPEVTFALTPRRMELLDFLAEHRVESITHLAETLKRDYKNVYDDIRVLSDYGLVSLVRDGRKVRPVPETQRITITIGPYTYGGSGEAAGRQIKGKE